MRQSNRARRHIHAWRPVDADGEVQVRARLDIIHRSEWYGSIPGDEASFCQAERPVRAW
jgi:hypothetical protein